MNQNNEVSSLSAIEKRRRKQIIDTTITILGEIGYTNTSLVKIADRANISIGLISYHFKNKEELMRQTLSEIMVKWRQYAIDAVSRHNSAPEQLSAYIRANIEYMVDRPQLFPAFIEIVFNARNEHGVLLYRVGEDDPALIQLEKIIVKGIEEGAFRPLPVRTATLAIRASIDQFLGQLPIRSGFDATQYITELIGLVASMVKKHS